MVALKRNANQQKTNKHSNINSVGQDTRFFVVRFQPMSGDIDSDSEEVEAFKYI